jgi:CRISPR-associated protein Cas1
MSTIYILSDYGKLSRQNDALVFSSPSGETRKLFLHQASRLIIAGSVELTGSALRMLMHHQVDTIFLSSNGKKLKKPFSKLRVPVLRDRPD